jgi:hypothetical protein
MLSRSFTCLSLVGGACDVSRFLQFVHSWVELPRDWALLFLSCLLRAGLIDLLPPIKIWSLSRSLRAFGGFQLERHLMLFVLCASFLNLCNQQLTSCLLLLFLMRQEFVESLIFFDECGRPTWEISFWSTANSLTTERSDYLQLKFLR